MGFLYDEKDFYDKWKNEHTAEWFGNQHNWIEKLDYFSCRCILLHQLCLLIPLLLIVYKQWEQFITTPFTSQHFHFAITCAWGAYHLGTLFEVLLTGFSKEQSSFIHLSIKQKALLSDSFSYFQSINKRHKYSAIHCHHGEKKEQYTKHYCCATAIHVNMRSTQTPIKLKEAMLKQFLVDCAQRLFSILRICLVISFIFFFWVRIWEFHILPLKKPFL